LYILKDSELHGSLTPTFYNTISLCKTKVYIYLLMLLH
jgi:hypothetical protein